MSLPDFVERLVAIFDRAGIDYMIVGSMASTVHGLARMTQDIDIVVELDLNGLGVLLMQCPEEDYYVSDSAARDAIQYESMFNIIDMATGWKADLIVRKTRPFSQEEFQRRQRATLVGLDVFIASAEDTIVAKLEWALRGSSERQLRDIAGILDVCGERLDHAYISRWTQRLGLEELWEQAKALQTSGS